MRALLVVALAAGCEGGQSPGPILVENDGKLCLFASNPQFGAPAEQFFVENARVFVQVSLDMCLSSSCTEDEVTACAVAGAGPTLDVTSELSFVDVSSSMNACTDDCLMLAAVCESGPLPAGSYTFTIGTRAVPLTIPSSVVTPPCSN